MVSTETSPPPNPRRVKSGPGDLWVSFLLLQWLSWALHCSSEHLCSPGRPEAGQDTWGQSGFQSQRHASGPCPGLQCRLTLWAVLLPGTPADS